MKNENYRWIVQLALAMPSALNAMAEHPLATVGLMVFVYVVTRKQR